MAYRVVLSFILLFLAFVQSDEQCREIVHLNFANVRDGLSSNTHPFPRHTGAPCNPERAALFCSGTTYPNDIFCGIGRVRLHSSWSRNASIVDFDLSFAHPSAEGTFCKVTLTSPASGEGSEYLISGAECDGPVDDQTIPRFNTSQLIGVQIKAFSRRAGGSTTGDYFYDEDDCWRQVFQFGRARVVGGCKGASGRLVVFEMLQSYCMSIPTTMIGGRDEEMVLFSHDGRRYRPSSP